MNEIIELLSAAVARENAAGAPSRMKAPSTNPCMFVVATTLDETRHALEVARPLACGCGCRLAVVVPPTDHVTVSSGRAHAYRLPADELTSHPVVTEEIVRTLTADLNPPAEVMVAPGTVEALAGVLPPGATVVIAGPLARVVEPFEQRLARQLANRDFNVIFLPWASDHGPVQSDRAEPALG